MYFMLKYETKWEVLQSESSLMLLLARIPILGYFFQNYNSINWIENNTKQCPRCEVRIFKGNEFKTF